MDDRQFGDREETGPGSPAPPDAFAPLGDPPPWIVSQPPAESDHPVRPAGGRRSLLLLGGMAAVLLVVAAGGAFLVLRPDRLLWGTAAPATQTGGDAGEPGRGDAGGSGTPTEIVPTTESPPTTEPSPLADATTDPQRVALDRLDEITRQDLTRVPLRGQYVAQLASKNPGTYDKYQSTAAGSHTFQAVDILRQHQELRDDPANGGVTVVLLKSTDYGKRQLYRGMPLYVTFALGAFANRQDVERWCAGRFPELSGDELGNQCAVRRLQPAP